MAAHTAASIRRARAAEIGPAVDTKPLIRSSFNPLRFSLPTTAAKPSHEERQRLIAKVAYFRAERRNFQPGHELEDWLAAENEVDRQWANDRPR
jgi:hypothetical protein